MLVAGQPVEDGLGSLVGNTAAGLLGCGVMAGLGAALNTGNVSRGKTVAVFGCGGVGDAAIAGSALAGASTIVGIDIDDRKLEWAKDFGATHTCNSTTTDPVEFVKSVTASGSRKSSPCSSLSSGATYRTSMRRSLPGSTG